MSREDCMLVPADRKIEIATQLASILPRLACFDDNLRIKLDDAKKQLQQQNDLQRYLETPEVKTAFLQIKNQQHHLLPTLLRIWYNQAHRFSAYEKIFFMLSSMTLIVATVLSHEIFVIYLQGKPLLRETGRAMKDYCTGGLTSHVIDTCSSLVPGEAALFDFNAHKKSPPFGNIYTQNNLPIGNIHQVTRWMNPIAWLDYFTCKRKSYEWFEMVAHAFHDSVKTTMEKVSAGFPTLSYQVPFNNPNLLMRNITLFAMTEFFIINYCIQLENGGYSSVKNTLNQTSGHFNGFERFAEDFETDSYLFAVPYFVITGFAFLTMSVLLSKAMLSKWHDSSSERQQFFAIREASDLIKKLDENQAQEYSTV